MKSIELTNEDKEQILEMCKELFPEFYSDNNNIFDIRGGDDDTWCIMHYDKKTRKWDTIIHWFEFCMRFLVPKLDELYFEKIMNPLDPYHVSNKGKNLNYPNNWRELWDFRPYEQWNHNCNGAHFKKHPIDYLYTEFKKLK